MEHGASLIRRLSEIGLTQGEIDSFFESGNNKDSQIDVLKRSRYRILDAVHEREKSIQQIDYLIYEIKKESGVKI